MRPHKHHLIIIQYALGAELEYYSERSGEWKPIDDPQFLEDIVYRVAPSPAGETQFFQLTKAREDYAKLLQTYMQLKIAYDKQCEAIKALSEKGAHQWP